MGTHRSCLVLLFWSLIGPDVAWTCGGVWEEEVDSHFYDHDLIVMKCIYDGISLSEIPDDISAVTEYLSLTNNELVDEDWDENIIANQITNLLGLDLSYNKFVMAPKMTVLNQTLLVLVLKNNLLTSFDFNYLINFASIRSISLLSNSLVNTSLVPLNPGVQKAMSEIDLSRNIYLQDVNLEILKGFSLYRLYLDDLPIDTFYLPKSNGDLNITAFVLRGSLITHVPGVNTLSSIRYLSLEYNQLQAVDMGNLSALPILEQLTLDSNPISELIPLSATLSLPLLQTWSCINCQLQGTLQLGYFVEWMMPNLQILALDMNQITDILAPTNDDTLPSLRDFKFNGNKLTELQLDVFATYIRSIAKIDVSANLITVVYPPSNLDALHNLSHLNLKFNPLTRIGEYCPAHFNSLPYGFQLDLTGTSLICDGCSLWLRNCPYNIEITKPICNSPDELYDEDLLTLSSNRVPAEGCTFFVEPTFSLNSFRKLRLLSVAEDTVLQSRPCLGRIDCARQCVEVGGKSFSMTSHQCLVYSQYTGDYHLV